MSTYSSTLKVTIQLQLQDYDFDLDQFMQLAINK